MKKLLRLLPVFFVLCNLSANAQDSAAGNSTNQGRDSLSIESDSTLIQSNADSLYSDTTVAGASEIIHPATKKITWQQDTAFTKLLSFSRQNKKGRTHLYEGKERSGTSDDILFYCLIFIAFFLALTKAAFPKYFNDIFSLSFQATFRQSQTREQITQNQLPGLMLNLLFVLAGGLFVALLAKYYKWSDLPLSQLFLYSAVILSIIYTGKYLFIQFAGWVFNARPQAGEYSFIVFLINKLIGISLVPLVFLVAYVDEPAKKISITISLCLVLLLICLRYIISMSRLRKNMHISAFHFFIYLCAVEIMPMLVVYKVLFIQTGK